MFASWFPSASPDKATVDVAIIGLIGAVIGYFIRNYLAQRQAYSSDNAVIKRNMYKGFVEALIRTYTTDVKSLQTHELETLQKAFKDASDQFYSTSVLFASPKVVRAYAELMRNIPQNEDEAKKVSPYELVLKASRIYKAMRKDIALSNRGLGRDGEVLMRAKMTDYDKTIGVYARRSNRFKRWLKAVW